MLLLLRQDSARLWLCIGCPPAAKTPPPSALTPMRTTASSALAAALLRGTDEAFLREDEATAAAQRLQAA